MRAGGQNSLFLWGKMTTLGLLIGSVSPHPFQLLTQVNGPTLRPATQSASKNQCALYLNEYRTCQKDKEFKVTVDLRDAGGRRIDAASREDPNEAVISGGSPLKVPGLNGAELSIAANGKDSVDFRYGGLSWTSMDGDARSSAFCQTNNWEGNVDVDCSNVIISKKKRQFLTEDKFAVAVSVFVLFFVFDSVPCIPHKVRR